MKIAVLGIRGLPPNYGGLETCADHVSKHWVSNGHEVLVYCRKNHYEDKLVSYNGVKLKYVFSISTRSLDTLSHTLLCCLDLIFRERTIKHVHLYNGGNALFLPLLKLFAKKVIISVDAIEWKRQKWGRLAKSIHKIGERLAAWFADEVITDNKVVETYYRDKYKIEAITIPYGAKIIALDENYRSEILKKHNLTSKKYFIFVGRLVPEKGVHRLIEAYNRLITDMPIVIIGDDDKDTKYKNELMKLKREKVIFMGYVYGAEYEALLANALLYVSASELEGTSPSLLAAMGARVCTLVNGIDENLQTIKDDNFYAGYYFKHNDVDDLCHVWGKLINNPELIKEMSERGYNLVMRRYRWEQVAEDYIKTFENI